MFYNSRSPHIKAMQRATSTLFLSSQILFPKGKSGSVDKGSPTSDIYVSQYWVSTDKEDCFKILSMRRGNKSSVPCKLSFLRLSNWSFIFLFPCRLTHFPVLTLITRLAGLWLFLQAFYPCISKNQSPLFFLLLLHIQFP